MTTFHICSAFYIGILFLAYRKMQKHTPLRKDSANTILYVLLGLAFLIRVIVAGTSEGFPSDTACFYGWASDVFENGFGSFYTSGGFADYPPVAVYILYWVGACLKMFHAGYLSFSSLLLLKLPSILCDLAITFLLYRFGTKHRIPQHQLLLLGALYLCNPAIFLNSSLWGQVDSIYTLLILLMCIFLTEGKLIPAYLVFGIGILTKPQTSVFTPVLIYGILDQVILHNFSVKNFFKNLCSGLAVILGMVLACLPFGLPEVISQYTDTLGSYPYIAVNAFNFWGIFGLNWIGQDKLLGPLSFEVWGTVILVLIVALSACFFFACRNQKSKYFSTAAFLITILFLFSIRMHERYLYPVLILLLMTYLMSPAKEYLLTFGLFSVFHFYNTGYVLYYYDIYNYDRKAPLFIWVSLGTVVTGIVFFYSLVRYEILGKKIAPLTQSYAGKGNAKASKATATYTGSSFAIAPTPSRKVLTFTKQDAVMLLAITLLYSFFALRDLGGLVTPENGMVLHQGERFELSFPTVPSRMYYFLGYDHNKEFQILLRQNDSTEWLVDSVTMGSVFAWSYKDLPEGVTAMELTPISENTSVMEICFTDADGNLITPTYDSKYAALFDEAATYPADGISFRNSTYFDEIYHARTAYEFLHHLDTYETTHPPLGKILISLGVAIFGMNPFGWRIVGTVFGILMVPAIYLLAKAISQNTVLSSFACFLFAFDFMHFTQTRIATIDVYVTFFIIMMYFFMYWYSNISFYDTDLKKTFLPLGACGLSMAFGIASKWTGIYAAAGLALIFFLTMYKRYREYCYAVKSPGKTTNGISHKEIVAHFPNYFWKTIGFCFGFFVGIPGVIYLLSYIPFVSGDRGLWSRMVHNQELMFSYHSGLEATHYYASSWNEWPIMKKPIFYYYGVIADEGGKHLRQGISAFGNPLVWWIGIPAFLFVLYHLIRKKDALAGFLIIGYMAQYLPWCLVPRLTFIYHYFPSVPFVVLMILYSAIKIKDMVPKKVFYILLGTYALLTFLVFILFYPVLAGQTVDTSFVFQYLRWNKDWILILE